MSSFVKVQVAGSGESDVINVVHVVRLVKYADNKTIVHLTSGQEIKVLMPINHAIFLFGGFSPMTEAENALVAKHLVNVRIPDEPQRPGSAPVAASVSPPGKPEKGKRISEDII